MAVVNRSKLGTFIVDFGCVHMGVVLAYLSITQQDVMFHPVV